MSLAHTHRTPARFSVAGAAVAVILAHGAMACRSARGPGGETGPAPAATAESQPTPPAGSPATAQATRTSTAELQALYEARADSARMNFTAADVDFMTGMIGHHAQALVMARLAPTHGASPQIQTLAARIINAQKDEIATMQGWLRARGQTVPEVEIDGTRLTVHGAEGATHMPGMLTEEQMRELDEARGAQFDRVFLTYMIHHHKGAVTMVHDLFDTDGAAQDEAAFKLASDIQVDQLTEIGRMELMLEERSSAGEAQPDGNEGKPRRETGLALDS